MKNPVGPHRANRFLGDPLRPYGRIDIGSDDGWLLEEGWHAAEREGASTFRWAYSPAIVLIPLDHAAPLTLRIRLHAFTYPGWGSQRLSVTINNRDFPPVPIGGDWNVVEVATDAGVWHGGVNRVKMQFQTVQTPAAVGLSGDTRELAAAVDYILLSAQ